MLKKYTATGPETATGILTVESWKPYNGYSVTAIRPDMNIFMEIQVKAEHDIPTGGKIELTFESKLDSSYGCFISKTNV